jgi:hypothetical protein
MKNTKQQADKMSMELFLKAIDLGFTSQEAQMILNVSHDIALNGEQTHAPELLSQFY